MIYNTKFTQPLLLYLLSTHHGRHVCMFLKDLSKDDETTPLSEPSTASEAEEAGSVASAVISTLLVLALVVIAGGFLFVYGKRILFTFVCLLLLVRLGWVCLLSFLYLWLTSCPPEAYTLTGMWAGPAMRIMRS